MNAVIHHPGRVIAVGVAVAVALLALAPGSWGSALAQTAGTPTPITCAEGFTQTADGGCVKVVTNPPVTLTGVTAGQEVTIGDATSPVTVTIPTGYPAGAEFTVQTETTVTIESDGTETRVDRVVSLQCTGNCTQDPVTMRVSFSLLGITSQDLIGQTFCEALGLADPCLTSFVASSSFASRLEPGHGQQLISFGVTGPDGDPVEPRQTGPSVVDARITADGFIEGDLPPGDWGIQAVAAADAGGADVPTPADTGMGGVETASGATNPLAIALGAVALAGIAGLGARYAVRRGRA